MDLVRPGLCAKWTNTAVGKVGFEQVRVQLLADTTQWPEGALDMPPLYTHREVRNNYDITCQWTDSS